MLEIARHDNVMGVLQKDIAEKQELSNKYLDHIIHGLKTAGLITNVRGKKSGYRLTRDPKEITVLDVYYAMEPGICLVECLTCDYVCERQPACLTQSFWKRLNQIVISYMKTATLEDLMLQRITTDYFQEDILQIVTANHSHT